MASIDHKTVNQAIARFAIVSDPHIGWGNRDHSFSSLSSEKTVAAFEALADLVPDLDALLIAGDLNNLNDQRERDEWSNVIIPAFAQAFRSRDILPSIQMVMGNHDFWWYSQQRFETFYGDLFEKILLPCGYPQSDDDLGQLQNTCVEIAGITIIKLCGEEEMSERPIANANTHHYSWQFDHLRTALAAARARNPHLPIIVISHHGISGLRLSKDAGGDYGEGTERDMIKLMQDYPQVIFISGHVHNPMNHPAVISQDLGFTCLFAGTIGSYLSDEFETPRRALLKRHDGYSNGMIMDIFDDGTVTIHKIDFGEYRQIGSPVSFTQSSAAERHLSFVRLMSQSQAPRFPAGATICQTGWNQVMFTQAVGTDDCSANGVADHSMDSGDFAYYYRIKVTNPETGLARHGRDFIIRSDYHKAIMDRQRVISGFGGSARDYIITPYNAFDVPGRPLFGNSKPAVISYSGADRYETSVLVSMAAFERSEYVIIASGLSFPEALAASGLAGLLDAPLLLSGDEGLPDPCLKEMIRLGAKQVVLIGDLPTRNSLLVSDLLAVGIESSQLTYHSGEDCRRTAEKVYAQNNGWGTTAIIANVSNLTQAGSASTLAYRLKAPILFTDSSGVLDEDLLELIKSGGFKKLLVFGSKESLRLIRGKRLADYLPDCSIVRIWGKSRYDAAVQTAHWAITNDILTTSSVGIATANTFADAITGGILQATTGSVLLLCDPGYQRDVLNQMDGSITKLEQIRFFGGANTLPASFRSKLKRMLY